MLLGLTRLHDALRGDSRAEELALMEAHGVATPEEFSRADPPFDSCLDAYVAHYLGVASAAAGRMTCRAWCTALGRTQTMAQLVQREATHANAAALKIRVQAPPHLYLSRAGSNTVVRSTTGEVGELTNRCAASWAPS